MIQIYILCVFILGIIPGELFAQSEKINQNEYYNNFNYRFSISIPSGWNYKEESIDDKNLNLIIQDKNDLTQIINVYAIKNDSEINLEKFSALDTLLFENLGNLTETKPDIDNGYIIKSYKNNEIHSKIYFKCRANYGYIIIWRSLKDDSSVFTEVCDGFAFEIPFLERAYVTISSYMKTSVGLVVGIILLILSAIGLWLIGYLLNKNFQFIKVLDVMISGNKIQREIELLKKMKNTKKTINMSILSVIGILYLFVFIFNPFKMFLLSLIAIVPIVLGILGIVIGPGDD